MCDREREWRENVEEGHKESVCVERRECGSKNILHMYCCGTRKSHPRTRIICQKRGPQQYIMMDTFSRPLCDFLRFYMNSVSSAQFFRFFVFVPI